MNHQSTYLHSILTAEQYADYKRACQQDQRDSEARKRWRVIANAAHANSDRYQQYAAASLCWLQKHEYADMHEKSTGKV